MIIDNLKKKEPIGGKWYVKELIEKEEHFEVYSVVDAIGTRASIKTVILPDLKTVEEYEEMYGKSASTNDLIISAIEEQIEKLFETFGKLQGLKSDKIIKIYDFGKFIFPEGYCVYMVTEPAESLVNYFSKTRLNIGMALKVGSDVAKALEICESNNLAHGFVNDKNIFTDSNGTYKLGNFGIDELFKNIRLNSGDLNREYFAAPENILKNEINNTTDIYSLGMVMYRLFNFNRFPFLPSKDESYAISEYADEKAYQRRISGENPASPMYASENTAEIICKCCRYEKEERYQKAAEVAEAIDNAMKTENLTDVLDYPSFSAYGSKTEMVEKEEHNVPIPEDKGPKSINVEPEKKQDTEVENENIYTMGAQAYYTEAMGSIKNNRQVDIDGESLQNIDEVSKKIAEKYGYESKEFRKFTEKLRILEDVKENNEILKKDNKKRALTIKILCGVACAAIIVGIVFLLNTDTYYINQGQFDRIYKKNLIGTTECFKEVPAENLIKKSKYLYYINQEDRKLYKSSIKNGTDEEVLSEDAVTVFRIKDDYIYYLNTGDDDKLYRMETDGTDVSCVYDKRCASISLEDGNIEIVPADNPSDLLILNTKDLSVKEALVD